MYLSSLFVYVGLLNRNYPSFIPLVAIWAVDPAKVVVPSSRTVAVVENLTPASAYHFRVLAENSIGSVSYTHLTLPTIYSV